MSTTIKTQTKRAGRREAKEFLVEAPEVSIFMAAYGLVTEIQRQRQLRRAKEITEKSHGKRVRTLLHQVLELMEATTRFDILMPVSGVHISSFVWRWYNWWGDYLESLPVETIKRVEDLARSRDPGVADFRPPGDWIAYRANSPFMVVMVEA